MLVTIQDDNVFGGRASATNSVGSQQSIPEIVQDSNSSSNHGSVNSLPGPPSVQDIHSRDSRVSSTIIYEILTHTITKYYSSNMIPYSQNALWVYGICVLHH